MHSAKCVVEAPARGSAQSACVGFATEFLRGDDSKAFRSSTFFDQPERLEMALRAASLSNDRHDQLEDAVDDSLILAGKTVDVRRCSSSSDDERFLLPQLSALLVALRGTPGCIVVSSKTTTLCVGVDGSDREASTVEEDLVDLLDPPPALSTVCYDPTPRPLFKLDGASALRFSSVRGLQLHVLAVLSSVEDSRLSGENVRLSLLVSSDRRDHARLKLIERDIYALRKTEKKRAIAIQRAEVEALRERLLKEARVEPKRPPSHDNALDALPPPPQPVTTATTDASLERHPADLDTENEPRAAADDVSSQENADLVQAALAAYSSSLQPDEPPRSSLVEKYRPTDEKDLQVVRETTDSALRALLASIEGEDAALFGARLYDVMRQKTLSDKALTELQPSASIDLPQSSGTYRLHPRETHEQRLMPVPPPQTKPALELPESPTTQAREPVHSPLAIANAPALLEVKADEERAALLETEDQDGGELALFQEKERAPAASIQTTRDSANVIPKEQSSIQNARGDHDDLVSPARDESSIVLDAVPSRDAKKEGVPRAQNTRKRRLREEAHQSPATSSLSRTEVLVDGPQRQSSDYDFVVSSLEPRIEDSVAAVAPLRESFVIQETAGFVDVETKDEELMFFGENTVTLDSLKNDPLLQALEQVVREERRLAEDAGEPLDDDVLEAAAEIDLRSAAENFDAKSKTPATTATKTRPTGWAATYDLASDGDVFATRTTNVPKPPQLQARATALADRNAENLAKMQRFNEMRAKKARAMEERRRLEKEHHAALRAGAFQDDENDVKAEIRRASTTTTTKGRRRTTTASMPPARKMTNARNITNALVQVCLAGPHCATSLADALAAVEKSHADNHVILLKDDAVRSFLGIFALRRGRSATNSGGPYVDAEKIFGRGPRRFDESVITTFFKYNSASRAFQSLPSRSFTFTTDAVVVHPSHFKARHVPTY